MKPVSLANISYAQGLKLLALRKEALDSGSAEKLPPEVLCDSYPLRDIGRSYSEKLGFDYKSMLADPAVKSTLIGGGLGAALGAGKSYLSGDEEEKDHLGRNMLMGGVGGAALGGAAGLYANPKSLNKLVDPVTNAVTKSNPVSPDLRAEDAAKAVSEFADLSGKADTAMPEAEYLILTGGSGLAANKGLKDLMTPIASPEASNKSLFRIATQEATERADHAAQQAQRKKDFDTNKSLKGNEQFKYEDFKADANRNKFFTEANIDPKKLVSGAGDIADEESFAKYLASQGLSPEAQRQYAEELSGLKNVGSTAFDDYFTSKGGLRMADDLRNVFKNPARGMRLIRGGGLLGAGAAGGLYSFNRYLNQRNERDAAKRSLEEIRKKLGL